jgi:hypothetical protein
MEPVRYDEPSFQYTKLLAPKPEEPSSDLIAAAVPQPNAPPRAPYDKVKVLKSLKMEPVCYDEPSFQYTKLLAPKPEEPSSDLIAAAVPQPNAQPRAPYDEVKVLKSLKMEPVFFMTNLHFNIPSYWLQNPKNPHQIL